MFLKDLDPDIFVVMCQEWQHQDLIDRMEDVFLFAVSELAKKTVHTFAGHFLWRGINLLFLIIRQGLKRPVFSEGCTFDMVVCDINSFPCWCLKESHC